MSSIHKKSMKRLSLTSTQKAVLEALYAMDKVPDSATRDNLTVYLGLTSRQVQVWFPRAPACGGPATLGASAPLASRRAGAIPRLTAPPVGDTPSKRGALALCT